MTPEASEAVGAFDPDPIGQFAAWFEEARACTAMPEAVALATADGAGRPSVRMVLAKSWSEAGIVFFTNYESRKGLDLAENPYGALAFYWEPLGRQVRFEGPVTKIAPEDSDRYFATRPRGAQLSAAISEQSRPVTDRAVLERRIRDLIAALGEEPVPRPAHWGGYVLEPETAEFWQNQPDRLHDRFRYTRAVDSWRIERLQP
jgi:pyridoxamine 5'-phosphate oxidase